MAESDPNNEQEQKHVLLSGEGIQFLTHEHRELLRQITSSFAGGRAVECSVVISREVENLEHVPDHDPLPALKKEFYQFGRDHGYAQHKGARVWMRLGSVNNLEGHGYGKIPAGKYPLISYLGPETLREDRRPVDMRSVSNRLIATECDRRLWRFSETEMNFLKHITNVYVQPEEPLPVEPPAWRGGK